MAEKTLNTRQKQKYDTSTNWATNNIVLLAGEIGIESDTNKFKVGNGTSTWNELDYTGGSEIPLYSTTGQNTDGAMTQKAVTDAIPTTLSDLTEDSSHRTVTDAEKTTWNNKSNFSGDYDDLTNKPTIPTALSELSEDATHRLVTDTEKSTWNAKSNFSGSYNDLTDKPTIPTININGASQSTINFDSDPQTQITQNTQDIEALQNGKVDKATGKQLSTEDFTTAEKNKLAGLNNYDDTQVKAEITELQSADEQNVKISGAQDIGGSKNFLRWPDVKGYPIIKNGTNTKGYYVKYADGTLLCAGKIYSGLTKGVKITFPQPFKQGSTRENIYVLTQMEREEGFSATYMNSQAIRSISATGFIVYAGYSETVYVNWIAIGRWK